MTHLLSLLDSIHAAFFFAKMYKIYAIAQFMYTGLSYGLYVGGFAREWYAQALDDDAAADYPFAVIDDGGLAWRDCTDRVRKLNGRFVVC